EIKQKRPSQLYFETASFLCSIGIEKHQGLGKTLSIKKAREIRFKPASRAFYVITLIIFCEIMLLAFWL
ncbi:hypothetical protein, partial [Phocaeicola plebeius]